MPSMTSTPPSRRTSKSARPYTCRSFIYVHIFIRRETERKKERERETERQRDRDPYSDREKQIEK